MRAADPEDNTVVGASSSGGSNPTSTEGMELYEMIENCFDLRISGSGNDITIKFRDRPITVNYETFLELRKKLEAVANRYASTKAKQRFGDEFMERFAKELGSMKGGTGYDLLLLTQVVIPAAKRAIAALDEEGRTLLLKERTTQ